MRFGGTLIGVLSVRRLLFVVGSVALLHAAAPDNTASAQNWEQPEVNETLQDPFVGRSSGGTTFRDGNTEVTTTVDADAFEWRDVADGESNTYAAESDRFILHNSFLGAVGGIRVVDAGSAPEGTFRVGLMTEFFVLDDFIASGDRAKHFGGALSLSYTVHRHIEVFAALEATSDRNNSATPDLIQALGDTTLGVKGFHAINPWLTVGGDATVAFLNGTGSTRDAFRSTSGGLRANVSTDLRMLPRRTIPIIARFNAQYWLDNSEHLVEGIEDSRYAALANAAARVIETRHLISPAERFAYGVNRVDRVNVGLGLEAPLKAGKVGLHPLFEWTWAIPVNRQGHRCAFASPASGVPAPATGSESCLAQRKAKAFPMALVMGLRILPPVRGLAVTVGAESGVLGSREFVRELAPTAPYRVFAGLSYAYDPKRRATETPKTPALLEYPAAGTVVDAESNTPVSGAIVSIDGAEGGPWATDAKGRFESAPLPAGEVTFTVTHSDYEPARCTQIVGGAEVPNATTGSGAAAAGNTCALKRIAPAVGSATIQVNDDAGKPVEGVDVSLRGSDARSVRTDASGAIQAADLAPGAYSAHVDDKAYFVTVQDFTVVAGGNANVSLRLVKRPKRPKVRVGKRSLSLSRQISFATGSDEILPNSEPLLLEIADVLNRNPNLLRIEIQGHTDNRGGHRYNMQLSQKRAEAVRRWLIEHNVDAGRLAAKGYGPNRPLAPNITARNRARNRRVQLQIRERAK